MSFYIGGTFTNELSIPFFDLGFLRGYGLSEYFRTYERCPLFLKQRLDRLRLGCATLGISLQENDLAIEEIIQTLIGNSTSGELGIRIIATKGTSIDGISPGKEGNLFIATTPLTLPPLDFYAKGIKTITTYAVRTLPNIKTLSYLPGLLALDEARAQGAAEALYLDAKGNILEGVTSNFFAFKEGKLITPPTDAILPGITRATLLEEALRYFRVEVRPIPLLESNLFEEAFTTSSVKGILPIIAIDGHLIGTGYPGTKTKKLIELFQQRVRRELQSYSIPFAIAPSSKSKDF